MSLRRVAALAALALVAVGAGGVAWLRAPLPPRDGSFRLPGLSARAEVRYDRAGIPHVRAASEDDAARVLGWLHAGDRLFQMEMRRRAARGRLAEVLGPGLLGADEESRRAGHVERAETDLRRLEPRSRRWLDAYAEGASAWIASQPRPIELVALGVKPAAWTALDSMAFGRLMMASLSMSAREERRRFEGLGRHGAATYLGFLDLGGGTRTFLAPAVADLAGRLRPPATAPAAASEKPPGGSNAWALAGARTASGRPLLAGDPHLAPEVPGVWYLAHLASDGTVGVAGLTLAGLPAVVIGRNADVAWSITMNQGDDTDLFLERLDPTGTLVDGASGPVPLRVRRETIPVKGAPPAEREFLDGPHGPLERIGDAGGASYALARSSTFDLDGFSPEPFAAAGRARSTGEFLAAWAGYRGVPINVVYAGADGHVGVLAAGAVPDRRRGDGRFPVPGWDGAFEWRGVRTGDALPRRADPPEGLVASANDDWSASGAPLPFPGDYAGPERVTRIREFLSGLASATIDDLRVLQLDVASSFGRRVRDAVAALSLEGADARRAQAALAAWDGVARTEGPSRLAYEFLAELRRRTLARRERSAGASLPIGPEGLARMLEGRDGAGLWDDPSTPEQETRESRVAESLAAALSRVTAEDGPDPAGWRWGRVHRLQVRHPFWSRVPLIGPWLDEPAVPLPGDRTTVRVAAFSLGAGFDVREIPSARLLFDLSDPDRSRAVLPLGQSGQIQDPHYDDHLSAWAHGTDFPLAMTGAAVERESVSRLVLDP